MHNASEGQNSSSSSDDDELEFLALFGVNAPLNPCYTLTSMVGQKRHCRDSKQTGKD